jgi:sec-independent protein translocase protein TatB
MFDFAWSEIGLIAVVALIFIGPKDMPVAIKAVSGMVKKARKMAGEFQSHVDEMVKDADLSEVRDQIRQIRSFDLKGEVERAVDADGSLRRSMNEPVTQPRWEEPSYQSEHATTTIERPAGSDAAPEPTPVPAFLPPGTRVPYRLGEAPPPAAPAFVPPGRGLR